MRQGIGSLQQRRNLFIRSLAEENAYTKKARKIADDLFALDLTVYSSDYTFDSMIYNAFATSELDENISLHPEQMTILTEIEKNNALIVSAPISFGKTFCIFEYIARYQPNNIVLIVPTLALVDEYYKKIIKRYSEKFSKYKVHTNISEEKQYDFERNNIFVLTHDRVVQESVLVKLEKIDFLVVDEVYKLETDEKDDRVLVLNMAYYYLAQKAQKYVLLAPFIKEIIDKNNLEKNPFFYCSDYSPVVNNVIIKEIITSEDRFIQCDELVKELEGEKTLIYFATVTGKYGMYKYIEEVVCQENVVDNIPEPMRYFIEWAKDEIHEEWCVIKALEHGYLVHNGQIPVGTRIFQLDQYDEEDGFNKMLCTSTLLEGVNTTAKNIIIVQPARKNAKDGECFGAFDFYNLVGRTGRLNEHLIGTAYYIKGPKDIEFQMKDAIKSIRFEILDQTDDMDIQFGNIERNNSVKLFLDTLGITLEEYLGNIGSRLRFQTVKNLYDSFSDEKNNLELLLSRMAVNQQMGRYHLVLELLKICDNKEKKMEATLINSLLDKRRHKIKKVVDDAKKIYKKAEINYLISTAIKLKNSYIEHTFFNKVSIIKYFCELCGMGQEEIEVINQKILGPIEFIYFLNLKNKKMLIDIGIYERDIETIIKVIGDDFEDVTDLKKRLLDNMGALGSISYLSKYVISNLR